MTASSATTPSTAGGLRASPLEERSAAPAGTGRSRRLRNPLTAALLMLLVWLNGWIWSASLPYGRGPDEFDHWAMVSFLRSHHRLPVFGQEPELPVRVAPDGQPVEPYSLYPPLPYLLAAPLTLLPLEPWLGARLLSITAGAATVVVAWWFASTVYPGSSFLRGAIPAVVALLPQFTFVSAYLNADALAALLGALTLAVAVRGYLAGWTAMRLLGLGLLLGLDILARYTLFGLWPSVGVLLALGAARRPKPPQSPARESGAASPQPRGGGGALSRLALVAVPCLAVAGPWLARNAALYGEAIPERVLQAALAQASPGYALSYRARGLSLLDAALYPIWWLETFRSFWGAFDLQRLFYPSAVYYALCAACAVGGIGFIVALGRSLQRAWRDAGSTTGAEAGREVVLLAALALAVGASLALSLWSSWARDPSPQGRYLFPVLLPIAAGLAVGWRTVAALAGRRLASPPGAARRRPTWASWGLPVLVGLGLALNLGALALLLVPAYFGGGEPADAIVTLDVPAPGAPARGSTPLAGWAVERVRPGWAPGALLAPPPFYRAASRLEVTVDGEPVLQSALRPAARPDVARRFGDDSRLIETGFEGTLNVDLAGAGWRRLSVCAGAAPPSPTRCASAAVATPP